MCQNKLQICQNQTFRFVLGLKNREHLEYTHFCKLNWLNVPFFYINRAERFCLLCNQEEIGDEYHYLFVCPHFNNKRKTYLKRYFYTHPNTVKMYELFTSCGFKVNLMIESDTGTSMFVLWVCLNPLFSNLNFWREPGHINFPISLIRKEADLIRS